jgi:hypothetical protein
MIENIANFVGNCTGKMIDWGGSFPPHLPKRIPIQYGWLGSLAMLAASCAVHPHARRWSYAARNRIRNSNPQNRVLWFCREVYVQGDQIPVIRLARRVTLYHPFVNFLPFPMAFFAVFTTVQLYAAISTGNVYYWYIFNAPHPLDPFPQVVPLTFKHIKGMSFTFFLISSLFYEAIGKD